MIFFAAPAARGAADVSYALASDLYAMGDWPAARREALRALAARPSHDAALLLAADCALRLDPRSEAPRRVLDHLAAAAADPALRARSAYLAGRAHWANRDLPAAWSAYALAFRSAADRELFLRSGCALFLLRRIDDRLGAGDPALLQQLASCRNLWTFELRDEVRVDPAARREKSAGPAGWMVGFYRAQIRPAIGHRCSLDPNCSEYFMQASRAHGWLGVPLIGDRLVREPGVVQAAERPVERRGLIRYRDPLVDHTRWLKREP